MLNQKFETKVNRIIEAIQQEHEAEGLPRPKVNWTGSHENGWVELEVDSGFGAVIGWSNGSIADGAVVFEAIN